MKEELQRKGKVQTRREGEGESPAYSICLSECVRCGCAHISIPYSRKCCHIVGSGLAIHASCRHTLAGTGPYEGFVCVGQKKKKIIYHKAFLIQLFVCFFLPLLPFPPFFLLFFMHVRFDSARKQTTVVETKACY